MSVKIDEFDKKIMAILEHDGRVSFTIIAERLGISNTMVHKRYSKLIANGIIQKIQPAFNERLLGYTYCAYTGIILEFDYDINSIIEKLKEIPEIVECHYITGPYSLFLKIMCRDQDDFRRILYEELEKIKGISRSESFLDLGSAFSRNIISQDIF